MTNKHDKNDHKSGVVMSILGIFTVVAKKGDRFSLSPMSYVWRVTSIYQHLRKRNGSNFHTWFCKYQELAHLVICVCSPLHFLPHSPSSHAKDKLWNWCYKRCSLTWNPVFFLKKYLGEEEKLGLSVSKSLSLRFTCCQQQIEMRVNLPQEQAYLVLGGFEGMSLSYTLASQGKRMTPR